MTERNTEGRIRRLILLLAALVLLAVLAELWLVDHTGDWLQLVPFALSALGLVAVAAAALRPGKPTLVALRVIMALVAVGGVVGIGTHLLENLAFEQEIRPNSTLWAALTAGFKGAAPMLAPGILIFAALLAFVATYRHPALDEGAPQT